MNSASSYAQSSVLENPDLLRVIGEYLIFTQLPFILSFKAVRDALKPMNTISGDQRILSKKKRFVTSVPMVEWVQSLGCDFSLTRPYNNLFTYAAANGSMDVLKWAHQKYPPNKNLAQVNENVCRTAVMNGHLPVLEYLRSFGDIIKWKEDSCSIAAYAGHLHILQWLREVLDPPCQLTEGTCFNAAYGGHLHVLQWLRDQDPPCPWDDNTCCFAAQKGHLEVLKWLRSQDPPCPWVKSICIREAKDFNHYEVVEWILSQPE